MKHSRHKYKTIFINLYNPISLEDSVKTLQHEICKKYRCKLDNYIKDIDKLSDIIANKISIQLSNKTNNEQQKEIINEQSIQFTTDSVDDFTFEGL